MSLPIPTAAPVAEQSFQTGQFRPQTGRKEFIKRLFLVGPAYAQKPSMKVAAKEADRKALDYFTSTLIPCKTLRAVAVLTMKHALLLIGFAAGVMALVRLVLAD